MSAWPKKRDRTEPLHESGGGTPREGRRKPVVELVGTFIVQVGFRKIATAERKSGRKIIRSSSECATCSSGATCLIRRLRRRGPLCARAGIVLAGAAKETRLGIFDGDSPTDWPANETMAPAQQQCNLLAQLCQQATATAGHDSLWPAVMINCNELIIVAPLAAGVNNAARAACL